MVISFFLLKGKKGEGSIGGQRRFLGVFDICRGHITSDDEKIATTTAYYLFKTYVVGAAASSAAAAAAAAASDLWTCLGFCGSGRRSLFL